MQATGKRLVVALAVFVVTFALAAQTTLAAANGNSGGAGRSAPEAPHAMLLPVFGILAIGALWVVLARRRVRSRTTTDEAN